MIFLPPLSVIVVSAVSDISTSAVSELSSALYDISTSAVSELSSEGSYF